jgi:hypothetical protein
LLLCGGHQKVIDVVGASTQLLLNNNRRWELVLNHPRSMLLASRSTVGIGSHLSSNLRTFLARLVACPSSARSLVFVRATAHIQRCGQTPRRYGVWGILKMFFTANHGSAAPTAHWPLAWSPPPCWASNLSGEIISSYRKSQRVYR